MVSKLLDLCREKYRYYRGFIKLIENVMFERCSKLRTEIHICDRFIVDQKWFK